MEQKPTILSDEIESFPSGPQVVGTFIEDLKSQSDLDPNAVLAIEKLYRDKKLNASNLVKYLEEQRRMPKSES